jgi:intracellular septation protein A
MDENSPKEHKESFWLNLSLNVIIPAVIMMKLSKPEYLGQVKALVIALAFPFSYGVYDFAKAKKVNFISVLGLISVLLTGGIGLLKLDRNWMIVKETAIPALMGIAVLISQRLDKPIVELFIKKIMDIEKINAAFKEKGHDQLFEKKLHRVSYLLALTFFMSAALNYILAVRVLKGDPGTVEFNESLGEMTALSFPVITIPMMVMVSVIFVWLMNSIKKYTGLEIEEVVKEP